MTDYDFATAVAQPPPDTGAETEIERDLEFIVAEDDGVPVVK